MPFLQSFCTIFACTFMTTWRKQIGTLLRFANTTILIFGSRDNGAELRWGIFSHFWKHWWSRRWFFIRCMSEVFTNFVFFIFIDHFFILLNRRRAFGSRWEDIMNGKRISTIANTWNGKIISTNWHCCPIEQMMRDKSFEGTLRLWHLTLSGEK